MTKEQATREALRMALEALEIGKPMFDAYWGGSQFDQAITAIKEALAQPEQDIPKIGCVNHDCDKCKAQQEHEPSYWLGYGLQAHTEKPFEGATPVYTTPPQQSAIARSSSATPLKPLTDEQIEAIWREGIYSEGLLYEFNLFARVIEAAHGIKENT